MPWLTLALASSFKPTRAFRWARRTEGRKRQKLWHWRHCIITAAIYYAENPLSSHFRQPHFHLSSLMNRCCSAVGANMMDRVAGRHILLLRASERGHLDTEEHAGVPWLVCISHLLPIIALTSHLTFKCPSGLTPLRHSTTHCPVRPSPLSDILFRWLLTCNVPLSTTGGDSQTERSKYL